MSLLSSPIQARHASSLHRRFLLTAGVGGAILIMLSVAGVNFLLGRSVQTQGDARLTEAAARGVIVLTESMEDRTRQARVLAMTPEIIAAAQLGGARSKSLGIVGADVASLEKRFNQERSLSVAPATRQWLRAILPELDAAEILLTDENGYNAVTSALTSDFVQSDESWWTTAWRDGTSPAVAAYDSSAHQTTVSLAVTVRDGTTKVGVVKLGFGVGSLARALSAASDAIRIDVLDSADHVILSSDSAAVGRTLRNLPSGSGDSPDATSVSIASMNERALALRANGGRWRVVAHSPSDVLAAPFRTSRLAVFSGAAALLVMLALLLVLLNQFLNRRISNPARELAEAAEAVAAGDFTVELRRLSADDEMGRLSRAVGAMILELRRLAQAIASSARETTEMSTEITAGSEEMAATAGEIANTASDLSVQSTHMAETIASLAVSAGALSTLAAELDAGAHDGVDRNAVLRTLAHENRAGLDASAESLGSLSDDVHASATAIGALSDASEEIRSFVTLVRKLARQSKLLALNAAMEAARAGTQGAGFAVVATEVRRLASMSSDAAERTEAIVRGVLEGIDSSRESSNRAVATAEDVRAATARASESFAEIERAVADAEAWTASIEQTAATTSGLVVEMTQRLDSLSGGTEAFAAAMEQVAASSQEQSASTQEIAAAANSLGSAAERLTKLVNGLRVA